MCAGIPWGGGWKFAEKHSGVERRLPRPGYVVATAAGKPKAGWWAAGTRSDQPGRSVRSPTALIRARMADPSSRLIRPSRVDSVMSEAIRGSEGCLLY